MKRPIHNLPQLTVITGMVIAVLAVLWAATLPPDPRLVFSEGFLLALAIGIASVVIGTMLEAMR